MAIDFKIKRGPWSELFSEPGVIRDDIDIKEGYWYLCSDTAELFLGVQVDKTTCLKQVNAEATASILEEIRAELDKQKTVKLYQEVQSEYDLPVDFTAETFNPNVMYYVVHKNEAGERLGTCSTYLFDHGAQAYLCSTSVDMDTVRAEILQTIEITLNEAVASLLPDAIRAELKNMFAQNTILCGGNAN